MLGRAHSHIYNIIVRRLWGRGGGVDFSAPTKLIKSWKTSNDGENYNLLNHANKMYKHDI